LIAKYYVRRPEILSGYRRRESEAVEGAGFIGKWRDITGTKAEAR